MSQEMPPRIAPTDLDLERFIDRPFDLVARVRAAKEAAQREIEAFGNVSEYEIRKIYGQRTDLTYDYVEKNPEEPRRSTQESRESPDIELESNRSREHDRMQTAFDFEADVNPSRREEP
jgi:hypothetical protein